MQTWLISLAYLFLKQQRLLKQINDLTRKNKLLIWAEKQQSALEKIKRRLQKLLVLLLPNNNGIFIYIMKQGNLQTESAPYEIQNQKLKLIANVSNKILLSNQYSKLCKPLKK